MKEGTFVGGGYRWVSDGVEYDLSFKDYSKGIMNKVTLFQKLESPEVIRRSESHDTSVVNLILTLRGRLSKYAIFLDHLVKVILPVDPHVTLTVVYFSDNVMKTAENMTRLALSSFPSTKWVFVPVEKGPFSRGRGLHFRSPVDQVFDAPGIFEDRLLLRRRRSDAARVLRALP
ncbi:chondroitin sulfate N-acetylgalactosaminyltransferase 2-like [Macrobrachium rosenbergii]|uniref:chondroitin sulfate N-acetylgalactosaminyltransferase 2-like n=1 Tax=Macrobrachium rosenbergii TaxID=79674 RepID=UPI0034D62451